jgi:hypothetical protein
MTEKQVFGLKPTSRLEQVATNIPSECRIASIDPDDAMILPHDANPGRIEFSETTALLPGARAHCISIGRSAAQQRECMSIPPQLRGRASVMNAWRPFDHLVGSGKTMSEVSSAIFA